MPVPVSATAIFGFVVDVLLTVSVPVAAPATVGSNCKFKVTDCPALRTTGKVPPFRLKPVPATTAELTVTDCVPVDVSVTDCVVGVFRFTLPKAIVVAFTVSVAAPGAS